MEVKEKIMEVLKKEHPDLYWRWIREEHIQHHGPHYNEEMARHDVSKMFHTENGTRVRGEVVSMDEARKVRQKHAIPPSITDCDLYVAMNATYHDKKNLFRQWFPEEELMDHLEEEMYTSYIADEDGGEGMIWRWINTMMYD